MIDEGYIVPETIKLNNDQNCCATTSRGMKTLREKAQK